jgi:hypothetical protein
MTRKDYIKAAEIVREAYVHQKNGNGEAIEFAFVRLFAGDNPAFNETRFRNACKPDNYP